MQVSGSEGGVGGALMVVFSLVGFGSWQWQGWQQVCKQGVMVVVEGVG